MGQSSIRKRTPFFPCHEGSGAVFYEKSGWIRPSRYEATSITEHQRCRSTGGIFDVHSMGKIFVRGSGSGALLDLACTNDIRSLDVGRACYTCLCGEDGGIIDDLIVYRSSPEVFYLITNTVSRERVFVELSAGESCTAVIEDVTSSLAYIAVQGPASREVLAAAGVEADLSSTALPYFGCTNTMMHGVPVFLARTGYTGELGYELNFPAEFSLDVWGLLCSVGRAFDIRPCGGEALMSLRLEKGYRSYGSDIDAHVNPVEAGLGWTVAWNKSMFSGRASLLRARREGPNRRAVCVLGVGEASFSRGSKLLDDRDEVVGEVTSGLFGPSLGAHVGLAYVDRATPVDASLVVDRGSERGQVLCSPRPFFDPSGSRVRA